VLGGAAVLATIALIVVGVLLASGSSTSPTARALSAPREVGQAAPKAFAAAVRPRPAAPDSRSTVVAAPAGVQVFDRPGGTVIRRLSGRTELGAVQTLLTVGSAGAWWKVALPVRPNTATGWVRRADVHASVITTRIDIDRRAHRLTFVKDGKAVRQFPVAVGTRATPTPSGRFYVTDNLSTGNPGGAYGPYALGLSGHSDVLMTFGIGDGVLGIHGTDEPASIGTDASHGCVRLRNADITTLRAVVPLGTPVLVR
jgi:lipoprotein-anchoring transpeptidase ErfK/SrfK